MSPLKTWEMGGRKIGMRRIRGREGNGREGGRDGFVEQEV
jgi:hypothetical protein